MINITQDQKDITELQCELAVHRLSSRNLHNGTVCHRLATQGQINVYTAPKFKTEIDKAVGELPEKGGIIVNLLKGDYDTVEGGVFESEGTDYMDSSGFGALLSALKRARKVGGKICVITPGVDHPITRMFRITRLDTVFGVYASEDEAITNLAA